MDPLELLQVGLYSQESEEVLRALRRLETIALAVGPARARAELLPMLAQYATLRNAEDIASDNADAAASGAECAGASPLMESLDRVVLDEALAVMAEQLGELCSPIVQVPSSSVVPMLEALMQADETCVREAAVRGCIRIVSMAAAEQISELIIPCCERLARAAWFSGRCSASQLVVSIYRKITSDQGKTQLRSLFAKLCTDETPMVRKAAFMALPELCGLVGATFLRSDLFQSLRALCEEEQDSVRMLMTDCALEIVKNVDPTSQLELSVPLIDEGTVDISWRVRRQAARKFGAICKLSPPGILTDLMMPLAPRLFGDVEPEVRAAAVNESLLDVAEAAGPASIEQFLVPLVKPLASDPFDDVRFGFAKCISPLAVLVEPRTAQTLILPIILAMLLDDEFGIRCNVLDNLHVVVSAPENESWANSLSSTLLELASDAKWRLRLGVVRNIPILTKGAGRAVYEQKYHDMFLHLLDDPVSEVRKVSASQVRLLIENFGVEWGQKKLIPDILTFFESKTNYLHRLMPQQVIVECVSLFEPAFVTATFAPILLKASKDPTPNVRLASARNIGAIVPCLDAAYMADQVRPALEQLKEDTDGDVQYYAEQALMR